MTPKQISSMMLFLTITLSIAFVAFFIIQRKNAKKHSKTINYNVNKRNHVYFLYQMYHKIPLLRKYFFKIQNRYESLYPADAIAIAVMTTKAMTRALGAALAGGLLIVLISRGDLFYLGVGVVMVYVLFTQIINMSIEKLEAKLDLQLADFLSDVRHYYHDTGDVADAVYCTLDEVPYELGLHINKIYHVLISTNIEKEVAKYEDIAPNKFLKTFAAICTSIKEYGDIRMEDGQWLFLKNLNYLKEEVNIEILKRQKNNYLFQGLKFIAVSPMFFLKPIEMWAINNIPEMEGFYTGSGGTITMAITFALTILSYTMVVNLKDGRSDEFKENKIINSLSDLPFIRGVLTAEVNRNYSKSLRIADNLKIVGEKLTPKAFLLKRILYGLALMLIFNVIVFTSDARKRDNLMNDFSEAYESSIVPSQEYREHMREISSSYAQMARRLDDTPENKEALAQKISDDTGYILPYAKLIVEEIFTRLVEYHDTYYKWYMFLASLVFAAIGFYIPYLLLLYQISIMKMGMEDEVVQYQTLALILMHVDGITVDTLLEWMDRFAFCFKESVNECIVNLEYSVQKALEKMKDSEPFPPFKRFVDNILAVDNVGMASAFDEIESEREYYQKKREQDNEIIVNKKAAQGKIIAFAPLVSAIGLHMILPFMMMAIEMMSTMNEALTKL